jgi:hypothetical protein
MLPLLCMLQVFDSAILPTSLLERSNTERWPIFIQSAPAAPLPATSATLSGFRVAVDTARQRAIEYSDGYYTRLAIHKYASFATIPLFVLQYVSGRELLKNPGEGSWAHSVHGPVAASVAVLFGVNTVTGIWNAYDSRRDPSGRARRNIHSLLMLAADAGFVWTGALAPDDEGGSSAATNRHRTVAITSGSIALASYLMMLVWKD